MGATRPTRLLRTLREVRDYGERPISEDVLLDILEVARWTGSSKNSQPWELVVVGDREALLRLAAVVPNADQVVQAALAIVQVTTSAERVGDLGRQAERIMLAARGHGIGSCLVPVTSPVTQRRIRELLGIPPRRVVPAVIPLGYPAHVPDVTGTTEAAEGKEATRFLRALRTVRRYADRPIPDDVRREILEVARGGDLSDGSGGFGLMAVDDRDTLVELAALAPNGAHLAGAALAIVRVGLPPETAQALGRTAVTLNAGRLTERLMLAAWACGVGSCVIAIFPADNQRRAKQLLGTPADRGIGVVALGYPADERARFFSADPSVLLRPVPTGRTPLSQLVNWERYGCREPGASTSRVAVPKLSSSNPAV